MNIMRIVNCGVRSKVRGAWSVKRGAQDCFYATRHTLHATLLAILILSYIPAFADVTPTAQPSAEAAAVTAATAKVMTFDDCYNLAADNNRDYRIAKLDKAIAEAQLAKAASGFGPTMSVSGGYQPIFKALSIEIPAGVFGPSPILFPMGVQNYYSARLSLQQPVFTFGKTMFGFIIAKESYKIAEINFKKAGEKLKLDVISAFYGAMIAKEMSKAMEETMKANEEYLRITKVKFKNGQASNFDVLQAQVQYSNTVPEAQRASDGAKLAKQMLKNTLGMPLDSELEISGTTEYKKFEMSYEDIKKRFAEKNDDREIIDSSVKMAGAARNLSYAMLLPNLALSLNCTYLNGNRDFSLRPENWSTSWDGTLGFQWTFYDGFKNVAAIKEGMANAEKAEINKENIGNMLEIQLEQLYTSLSQSAKVIEAADELIKQANEGYRIAKESYRNGLIQSVDLLNAETGLLRAKMNYLSAMLNYTTTVEKLKNFIE